MIKRVAVRDLGYRPKLSVTHSNVTTKLLSWRCFILNSLKITVFIFFRMEPI